VTEQIVIEAPPAASSNQNWQAITARLHDAKHVTVLTGAGISAEIGLPTFRAGGLWESHHFEDVATPQAFERNPELVWRFYNHRREALTRAAPNPGHFAIRDIQLAMPDRFTLVTQNVDGLHQQAGSTDLIELHGSLRRVRCTACDWFEDTSAALPTLPRCACGALLRPGVVWFNESLPPGAWLNAEKAADRGGAMIVVGTSAVVYPAAGLIDIARSAGAFVIEVNPAATEASGRVHAILRGRAGVMMTELVRRWIGR
jgi:NAD-dependent deacetylase